MRNGWLIAAGTLWACATARPEIHPGPAATTHFAPPPGLSQISRAVELRIESLDLPKGTTVDVKFESASTTLETYAPQPDGSYLVTTTLLESVTSKNGIVQTERLPLVGISIVHRTDHYGRFLGLEDPKATLDAIHSRATPDLRQMIDSILTPESIANPMEAAWRHRFDDFCDRALSPGEVSYETDQQPVDEIGPIKSIIRRRVLGRVQAGTSDNIDIDLEVGGRDSELARTPGAQDRLLAFPEGIGWLSERVHGDGRRLMDPTTCQTVDEELTLKGEGRLNQNSAKRPATVSLPLRVRYEVHRQVFRMSPARAAAAGIPTTVVQPLPAPTAPPVGVNETPVSARAQLGP
jgi:hypothetical protein